MSKGFVLHIWGPGRADKLKKVYGPDLTAAELRPLVEDMSPDDPHPNDPDMVETGYVGRPGCEAEIAKLFSTEPLEGKYHIGSARWQRPEPDDVLEQQYADKIRGKKRVEGFGLSVFRGDDHVLGRTCTTLSADDLLPYLEGADEDDPDLMGGEYRVRPGAEAAISALFGTPVEVGEYFVGATYWYE